MIQKVHLQDFRNFKNKVLDFSDETTTIVGPNASGKTNILESLFFISTAKSFRARVEEEMINYDKDLCRVKSKLICGNYSRKCNDSRTHLDYRSG